jgi:4'-phosphopantetheinyl transferase EntD
VTAFADALAAVAARVGGHAASVSVDGGSRDSERAAGEQAAAVALAAAGSGDCRLAGRAADGCPRFPSGYAGSIAHAAGVAVAVVVTRSRARAAVGIDVEVSGALRVRDAELVLDAQERALVAAHPQPDWLATLLWSAKEAAFKAWSAATGGLGRVDPVDISVTVDEEAATVAVVATGPLSQAVDPFGAAVGAYREADGLLLMLVRVAEPDPAG